MLVYFLLHSQNAKNVWLLIVSLFFYAWGEGPFVLVMIGSIYLGWIFGNKIQNAPPEARRRRMIWGVSLALGILFYFKYSTFLTRSLNEAFGWNIGPPFPHMAAHLPIGVSFFTFQIVSYLIDIYRNQVTAEPSLKKMALYKSFFPQLIAGPIVRYVDIKTQLSSRSDSVENFNAGAIRFCFGLGKKVIIANAMGQMADLIYALPSNQLSTGLAWLGALAYTFQIYFDFSGYSDMAIGLARIFGFYFKENFNQPYLSTSITDFWRRWHISLSSWFRDYLYIPLGGNRVGTARTYLNLMIVFFLCGLWHGASWNFVAWGLYHGLFLVAERALGSKISFRPPVLIRFLYAFFVTIIGWVYFRAADLASAHAFLTRMFAGGGELDPVGVQFANLRVLNSYNLFHLVLAFIFCFAVPLLPAVRQRMLQPAERLSPQVSGLRMTVALFLLVVSMIYLSGTVYNPFIYYRF